MRVRTAEPSDAAAIGRLVVRAWQRAYRGLMPDDYLNGLRADDRAAMWTDILTNKLGPRSAVYAGENNDGQVVGFVAVGGEADDPQATRGEVYALNVDPNFWQHGVGRALLTAGCDHLRDVGFNTAVLWVHPGNTRACGFFNAQGWLTDGTERRIDALGVEVPVVRYRRNLVMEST